MRSSRFQLPSLSRRWSARRPSFTALLVALSVAVACAQWMVFAITSDVIFEPEMLNGLLGLSASSRALGHNWQFLTFVFVHAGPWHLLATMLPLYFAGREVEPILGARHFVGLYVLANLLGGLAQWGAMVAGWTPANAIFLGVSGGVAAIVAAFATILPELEVTLLLFFVMPLRVRAKRLTLGVIALGGLLWATQVVTVAGPVAIIVGALLGWAYAKQLGFGNPLVIERYFLERRLHAERLERMPVEQFISEELDPVLEKVSRSGLRSLSRAEKRLLRQGSTKLAEKP